MISSVKLGQRIRLAREKANLSQDQVAKHLGIHRPAVTLIESGKRKIDSLELLKFSYLVKEDVATFLQEEPTVYLKIYGNQGPKPLIVSLPATGKIVLAQENPVEFVRQAIQEKICAERLEEIDFELIAS